jgi:hypothetical protein
VALLVEADAAFVILEAVLLNMRDLKNWKLTIIDCTWNPVWQDGVAEPDGEKYET